MKKELIINKSKYPEKGKEYILWIHTETKRGENWRGIFKGSRKECINKRNVLSTQ